MRKRRTECWRAPSGSPARATLHSLQVLTTARALLPVPMPMPPAAIPRMAVASPVRPCDRATMPVPPAATPDAAKTAPEPHLHQALASA